MNIMAFDPGLSGGIAVLSASGMILHYQKMPVKPILENGVKTGKRIIDIAQVAAMVAKFEPEHVFIEKVHAMPKQGVTSTFTFGMGYGMLLGIFFSLEAVVNTQLVPPQKWQKYMYSTMQGVDELLPKARAMARFCELWPHLAVQNVTHDGIIDALLLAEYGRRTLSLN